MKKRNFVVVVLVVGFLLFSQQSMALAVQQSMRAVQSRFNLEFEVYRTADMPANWFRTFDGYYVTRAIGGNWIYGVRSQHGIMATNMLVGSVNPGMAMGQVWWIVPPVFAPVVFVPAPVFTYVPPVIQTRVYVTTTQTHTPPIFAPAATPPATLTPTPAFIPPVSQAAQAQANVQELSLPQSLQPMYIAQAPSAPNILPNQAAEISVPEINMGIVASVSNADFYEERFQRLVSRFQQDSNISAPTYSQPALIQEELRPTLPAPAFIPPGSREVQNLVLADPTPAPTYIPPGSRDAQTPAPISVPTPAYIPPRSQETQTQTPQHPVPVYIPPGSQTTASPLAAAPIPVYIPPGGQVAQEITSED